MDKTPAATKKEGHKPEKERRLRSRPQPRPRLPKIDIANYVKVINALQDFKRTMCGYCGNENISTAGMWICAYCESVNYDSMLAMRLNDKQLMGSLSVANGYMVDGDYAGAAAEYERMAAKYNDPQTLYSQAHFYLLYSNAEVASIRYDRQGFMEENSMHRIAASAVYSKALRILNKVSRMCEKAATENRNDIFLSYTWFIASVKSGDLKASKRAMTALATFNKPYLTEYAGMVFSSETGDHIGAVTHAQELLKKDSFSPNAFYYIALALFRLGRREDSRKLLAALEAQLPNDSIDALMQRIEGIDEQM